MLDHLQDTDLLRRHALIDGRWVDANSAETFAVLNPANGDVVQEVAKCGAIETREAIAAADRAFPAWSAKTANERAAILRNWASLILENKEDLARILTAEQGKPLAQARGEIDYGTSFVEWFAEEGRRVYGDIIPHPSNDRRIVCIKQPVGVVACITPWNFPNAMLTRKIAPALAAGCTVVCKPANETPLSAYALGELAQRAGVPAGVINMVSGKTKEIGEEMTSSPIVRKLTFTGSTPVGKALVAACASTMKRTSMELGGNAPFIVFDDADIDAAVAGTIASKFRNTGQTCVCTNRILVQAGVYDEFAEKLGIATKALMVGDGTEANVQIGPLIHEKAAGDVLQMIEEAMADGANAVVGGAQSPLGSTFLVPTVLTDVTTSMRVFREEIFGPVAPLLKFNTESQAVAMANDTEFGLAAYFYTRDISRVWRVAEALECGIVGINEGLISNEMAPFGGVKESGHGREGSKYGLNDYLNIKYLCMGGIDK